MTRVFALSLMLLLPLLQSAAQNFSNFPIVVRPLERVVNSAADDYAPVLSADRQAMYFTSYRSDGSKGEADLYVATRKGDAWMSSANAGDSFNSKANDGALAIAADGVTVYFASDGREGLGDTDILTGRLTDGRITDVRNLGDMVNSKYWDSQPTVCNDGKTIFFASNRPGGRGGVDIWMSTSDNWGVFAPAVPLSAVVNTPEDEVSPFVTPDGGTLFFSSNGHAGYGKYDVWMCTLDAGAWTQQVNLGPVINSDQDELFFYAPVKDKEFFLASSRRGGFGGLDIYAGSPNVFGAGMFRLTVSVLDSVSGKPLPSLVNIIDATTGNVLTSFVTNSQADEYSQLLPANRPYRVEAVIRDYPPRSVAVNDAPPNKEERAKLLFGPITVAEFDLGKYNIPFFVTGYYRPNTRTSLEEVIVLQEGALSGATYIESIKRDSKKYQQYKTYAETVEGIFQTVYTAGVDEIFPRFKTQGLPNEILEIRVTGYADPQPILGKYLEAETVPFVDSKGRAHVVKSGDVLDNLKLSGLRAWYSGKHMDQLFSAASQKGKSDYADLKAAGKIRYVYVGGDVSNDASDYAVQRRIRITMSRVSDAQRKGPDTDFDLNKNFK